MRHTNPPHSLWFELNQSRPRESAESAVACPLLKRISAPDSKIGGSRTDHPSISPPFKIGTPQNAGVKGISISHLQAKYREGELVAEHYRIPEEVDRSYINLHATNSEWEIVNVRS
jgi:hypothetical protein